MFHTGLWDFFFSNQ